MVCVQGPAGPPETRLAGHPPIGLPEYLTANPDVVAHLRATVA